LIRTVNQGLSRARNVGIQAAAGEIVAFIDADAAADPDWLYFLVTQMEAQGAAGCGGPNLSPPTDPELAQRVARWTWSRWQTVSILARELHRPR